MATLPPVFSADSATATARPTASRRKTASDELAFGMALGAAATQSLPAPAADVRKSVADGGEKEPVDRLRASLKAALGTASPAPTGKGVLPPHGAVKPTPGAISEDGHTATDNTTAGRGPDGASQAPGLASTRGKASRLSSAGAEPFHPSSPETRLGGRVGLEAAALPNIHKASGAEPRPKNVQPTLADPLHRAGAHDVRLRTGGNLPMSPSPRDTAGPLLQGSVVLAPPQGQGGIEPSLQMPPGLGRSARAGEQGVESLQSRTSRFILHVAAGHAAPPGVSPELALLNRLAAMRPQPGMLAAPSTGGRAVSSEETHAETSPEKARVRTGKRTTRETGGHAETPDPLPATRVVPEQSPASRRAGLHAEARRAESPSEPVHHAEKGANPAIATHQTSPPITAIHPETKDRNGAGGQERGAEPATAPSPGPARGSQGHRPPGVDGPSAGTRGATSAATPPWLDALVERSEQATQQTAWKSLEMQLDDGDGLVTIHVLRKQEKVAVSVGFSDPALRAQAEGQAAQIVETLQAQYQAEIDFSFYASGRDGSAGDTPDSPSGSARKTTTPATEPAVALSPSATPDRASRGGRHEWVG